MRPWVLGLVPEAVWFLQGPSGWQHHGLLERAQGVL